MSTIPFPQNNNFMLKPLSFNNVVPNQLIALFDNVTSFLIAKFDYNHHKLVCIEHRPDQNPEIFKTPILDLIFLSSDNSYFCQHIYQYSHELTHHILNTNSEDNKFKWFEETLCELASLYVLEHYSKTWGSNPPPFHSPAYQASIIKYYQDTKNRLDLPLNNDFKAWFQQVIPRLDIDRYWRKANGVIALNLLPIFLTIPGMWNICNYLHQIPINVDMDFNTYLDEWKQLLSDSDKSKLDFIRELFY